MKLKCIRPTMIAGVGIIRGGEVVTISDAYATDPRIAMNFKIVEAAKTKPKENASLVSEETLKAKCIKGIVKMGIKNVKDALVDNGIQFAPDAPDEKVAEIYYENFGFNTEPVQNEIVPE